MSVMRGGAAAGVCIGTIADANPGFIGLRSSNARSACRCMAIGASNLQSQNINVRLA
jgi:hypothetical protein